MVNLVVVFYAHKGRKLTTFYNMRTESSVVGQKQDRNTGTYEREGNENRKILGDVSEGENIVRRYRKR